MPSLLSKDDIPVYRDMLSILTPDINFRIPPNFNGQIISASCLSIGDMLENILYICTRAVKFLQNLVQRDETSKSPDD